MPIPVPAGVEIEITPGAVSVTGPRGSLSELGAAVADVHAIERREPVEIALAVLVVHVTAIAADDHRNLVIVVDPHTREVHP